MFNEPNDQFSQERQDLSTQEELQYLEELEKLDLDNRIVIGAEVGWKKHCLSAPRPDRL